MRLLVRMMAAVVLGVGTIFGAKNDQDAHWSDPPNWVVSSEEASAEDGSSGDPT